MFPWCMQDFSKMFSWCSDGSCGPGEIWWSFQMKVWTLMIQRSSMIPNYLMIPTIRDPQLFYVPQLFNDPQLFDDQLEVWTLIIQKSTVIPPSLMVSFTSRCGLRPRLKREVARSRGRVVKIQVRFQALLRQATRLLVLCSTSFCYCTQEQTSSAW